MTKNLSTGTVAHVVLVSGALLAGITGCKQAPAVDDTTLTTQVQQRLASDTAISNEPVQVAVRSGVVTLMGAVSSAAARTLAANDAAAIAGVKQVVNDTTVAQVAASTPAPTYTEPVRSSSTQRVERATTRPAPAPITRYTPPPAQSSTYLPPPSQAAPPRTVTPAQPVIRTITLPAGTTLPVRVTQTLDSATSQPGDTFSGALATDIVADGTVVLPRGAGVSGRIDEVHEAGHFKGSSLLTVELTGLNARGERISLSTQPYSVEGKGRGKNTAVKTGVGAAAGALLGGIFGGGRGAAIGAAAGGGTGAAINGVSRGEQVQIPSESVVSFVTVAPVTVRTTGRTDAYQASPTLQNRY